MILLNLHYLKNVNILWNVVEKENFLIQKEQEKITEKVDVTPEEVRLYFNGLKENLHEIK